MKNIETIGDRIVPQRPKKTCVLKGRNWEFNKMTVLDAANLSKINLKSRIDTTKNKMNRSHNDTNLLGKKKVVTETNPFTGNTVPEIHTFGRIEE